MLSNLNKEYKEKLEFIKNHFGEVNQKAKLLEELEEAEDEIKNFAAKYHYPTRVVDSDVDVDKLVEEITDCYVVAFQVDKVKFIDSLLEHIGEGCMDDGYKIIGYMKGWRGKEILKIAKQKIERTIERIEEGYYPNPNIMTCPKCDGEGEVDSGYGDYRLCSCGGTGEIDIRDL